MESRPAGLEKTMPEKTWKREAINYLQHMEKPRIEKTGEA